MGLAALFVGRELLAGGIERESQPGERHHIVETEIACGGVDADQRHLVDRVDPDMTGRFMARSHPDIDRDRAHHVLPMARIDMQSAQLGPRHEDGIDFGVTRHGLGREAQRAAQFRFGGREITFESGVLHHHRHHGGGRNASRFNVRREMNASHQAVLAILPAARENFRARFSGTMAARRMAVVVPKFALPLG